VVPLRRRFGRALTQFESQKTKNLVARPQCSLLILDVDVPQRYLELRGDVEVTADDGSFVEKVERNIAPTYVPTINRAMSELSFGLSRKKSTPLTCEADRLARERLNGSRRLNTYGHRRRTRRCRRGPRFRFLLVGSIR